MALSRRSLLAGTAAVVAAPASGGYLHVYGPSSVNDPSTLQLVQTVDFPGAHGLWYDDVHQRFWAVGQGKATSYAVSGSNRNTRLVGGVAVSIGAGNLGHSLDASRSGCRARGRRITGTVGTG